jgi:hypothetical protein
MKYACENCFKICLEKKCKDKKNAKFDTSCFCVEKQAEIKAKCFYTNSCSFTEGAFYNSVLTK